jgi:hypothetical protein
MNPSTRIPEGRTGLGVTPWSIYRIRQTYRTLLHLFSDLVHVATGADDVL